MSARTTEETGKQLILSVGFILLVLCSGILLIAQGCNTLQASDAIQEKAHVRQTIVKTAAGRIGSSYQYGGKGPDKFDCSGLVFYSFNQAGITMPGSSETQSKLAAGMKLSKAKSGDLVFFHRNGTVFHVSIIESYDGKALKVIHSTSSKGVIREDVLSSPYWNPKIYKIISLDDLKTNN